MEQKYNTSNAMVAFIDVLGSSSAIRNDVNESLNAIHIAYEETLIQFDKFSSESIHKPKVNIFSDNILLSCEIQDGKEEAAVLSIVFFSAILQMNMWINGILVRGGITAGRFFSDEIMVWGNALVRAYELEGKVAIYPRIVIEPEIADIIKIFNKKEKCKIICEDFDGLYFIDPFGMDNKMRNDLLETFIRENTERMKKCEKDLKTYQKINWLQQYFMESYNRLQ